MWANRILLPLPCYLGLVTNEPQLRREWKRLSLPKENFTFPSKSTNALTHFFTREKDGRTQSIILVCVHDTNRTFEPDTLALIVHEAVHVWQWVRDYLKEASPSAEFEAYAVQNITQELLTLWISQKTAAKRRR